MRESVPSPAVPHTEVDRYRYGSVHKRVKLKQAGRCRLIGVNTPETVAPRQQEGAPPDCYGPEASALTKGLLPPGSRVRIEFDVEPTDKYGRQLVYLYRATDGLFINSELVKKGAARRFKVPPNVRYDDMLVKLESDARSTRVGLWQSCPAGAVAPLTAKPLVNAKDVHDFRMQISDAPRSRYEREVVAADAGIDYGSLSVLHADVASPCGLATMNLVLLLAAEVEEINNTGFVLLPTTDRRAKHIATVLKPTSGATIRVGCVGVGVGRAGVQVLEDGQVCLSVAGKNSEASGNLRLSPLPPQPHVELLLAMPRPKVMMRLWSVLSQLGLRRVVLTNAWRVEKPYFSSQATDPSKYTPELLEGLEQAVCTTLPEVQIELRLKPFIEDSLETLFPAPRFLRLLCHPGDAGVPISEAICRAQAQSAPPQAVLLAVGPEGGWVDYEVELFRKHGFTQVSLGSRILTTDVALVSLVALTRDALERSTEKKAVKG
ncbi:nucI [Symbiodinium pilosum]|uniref:16S rRNA (uracil(1498)-N(3))-methyltransferase n=1 Tax=Symbiodinium pilosum TaxID=2952 RepID=A0A812KD28_SYMPI|nr:nucI [Symbiodinium pilosum]